MASLPLLEGRRKTKYVRCQTCNVWDMVGAEEMIFTTLLTTGKIVKETMFSKIGKRDILHSVPAASLFLLFSPPVEVWYFMFFISKLVLNWH